MIVLNAGLFTKEVKSLVKIAEVKTGIEITQCLHIKPYNDTFIEVLATNLELSMGVIVEAKFDPSVIQPFCVDAKLTANLFSKLGNSIVTITFVEDSSVIKIKSDYGNYTLPTIKADEFPLPLEPSSDPCVSVSPALFSKVLGKAKSFSDPGDMRPVLSGVVLQFSVDTLNVAATSGFIMYVAVLANEIDDLPKDSPKEVIISKAAVLALVDKISKSDTQNIEVFFDKTSAFFVTESWSLQARTVDGKYPNYSSVIPALNTATATFKVNKQRFIEAGDRVDSVVGLNALRIQFSKKESFLSHENLMNNSSAKELIEASSFGAGEIGFAWKEALRTVVTNIDATEIEFNYIARDRPMTCFTETEEVSETFLAMPLKL
jgi:DNA polymerase III subunit beta